MKKYPNKVLSVILTGLMLVIISAPVFAQSYPKNDFNEILNSKDMKVAAATTLKKYNFMLPDLVEYTLKDAEAGKALAQKNKSTDWFAKMLIEVYEKEVMAWHYDRISYFLGGNNIIDQYKNPYTGGYDPIKLANEVHNAAARLREIWDEIVEGSNPPNTSTWGNYYFHPEQVRRYEKELTAEVEKYHKKVADIEKKYPGAKIARIGLPSFNVKEGKIGKYNPSTIMMLPNIKKYDYVNNLLDGEASWKNLNKAKKYLDDANIKYKTLAKTAVLIKSLEDPQEQNPALWNELTTVFSC